MRSSARRIGPCTVFAIDGRAVGLDLFDHSHTLQRLFLKLVRSYALDAIETAAAAVPRRTGNVSIKGILEGIAAATLFTQPAVGLGQDVRISARPMSGGALWAADRYIHICAFAMSAADAHGTVRTPIRRPTQRRHPYGRAGSPTPTAQSARASVGRRNDVTHKVGLAPRRPRHSPHAHPSADATTSPIRSGWLPQESPGGGSQHGGRAV